MNRQPNLVTSIIFLISLAMLSGCYIGIEDIKSNPEYFQGRIEADKDYQEVYRRLRAMSEKCLKRVTLAYEIEVSGELYSDSREGTVRVKIVSDSIRGIVGQMDLKAIQDNKTEVKLYGPKNDENSCPSVDTATKWIDGVDYCPNKAKDTTTFQSQTFD